MRDTLLAAEGPVCVMPQTVCPQADGWSCGHREVLACKALLARTAASLMASSEPDSFSHAKTLSSKP